MEQQDEDGLWQQMQSEGASEHWSPQDVQRLAQDMPDPAEDDLIDTGTGSVARQYWLLAPSQTHVCCCNPGRFEWQCC